MNGASKPRDESRPHDRKGLPLSSEYGTYKTVRARFWPWLQGESPYFLFRCFLLEINTNFTLKENIIKRNKDLNLEVEGAHRVQLSTRRACKGAYRFRAKREHLQPF
jgi:hypothetical protein